MFRHLGRSNSVSYFRRLVIDLMHFSSSVPTVILERRMNLTALAAAREAARPSPTWSAIFTKAFAIVSSRVPALRTSYLKFPWPRFYEHPITIATLSIDRPLAKERIVLYVHIEQPETLALGEIDAQIREHQEIPVEKLVSYRRAVRMSWIPWPLRQWLWWAGLNVLGPIRCHNFGTFGFTSLGAQGAGILQLVPLLTTTIYYGLFEPTGELQVRLAFDHRVLDGSSAAEALGQLEEVLTNEILKECQTILKGGTP